LRAGIEPGAALLSEAQAWQLCAQQYAARTYQYMEARTLWHVSYVRQLADDCSNHLVDPREIVAWDEQFLENIKNSADKIAAKIVDASRKRIELAGVVEAYQQAKEARRVLDYGDQIRLASEIAADPRVVADFLSRYRFALLDEYQDTNIAQARMLKRLMPDGYPVMAVGDPDQNIYAWRGASLHNLLVFPEQIARTHAAGTTPWREIAILCRKKRLFGPLVEELRAREVPLEVIGLGGLLRMPEVIDLVSLLRVLEDPMRNVALARLLRGPRWRIGHRDLALIARRAAEKNRSLKEQLGDLDAPGDVIFSLAEAVAAADEVEGLSDEARARLEHFNAVLTELRAQSPLP